MGKKYTTDEIHIGGHNLNASMMEDLNTVVSNQPSYLSTATGLEVFRSEKNIDDQGTYMFAQDDGGWTGGNRLAGAHNGYGVISMHLHSGNYYGQIHLSSQTGDMGIRFQENSTTWSSIYTVHTSKHFSTADVANGVTAHGWGNHATAGYITGSYLPIGGKAADSDLLDGIDSTQFVRSDADDSLSGQYTFTKTNDHAIKVGTIRGTSVGTQTGEFIHMYNRVNIGSPSGWGASNTAAPNYGLSTYGGTRLAVYTDYTESGGSMRAPLFYDSNNTTYYIDPSATGDSININGAINLKSSHAGGNIKMHYDYDGNDLYKGNMVMFMSEPGVTHDGGGIGTNIDGRSPYYGRAINHGYGVYLRFAKTDGTFEFWNTSGTAGVGGGRGTKRFWGDASGATFSQSSSRAPIFYDSDNTGFYINPDATSNIRYLKVNTTGSSSSTRALTIKADGQSELNFGSYPASWTSALQIQNNNNSNFIWISPLDNGEDARFRTGGSGLDFYTDGANDTGTHSLFVGSGYAQGISSLRAPIFYDSNNTGYYLNPASTSNLNAVNWSGGSSANANTAYTHSQATHAPTNAEANVQSDWNATSGDAFILNKPSTFAPSAHNQAWSTITSTPTTLGGYGITDVQPTYINHGVQGDHDLHTWDKVHAVYSDAGGSSTYWLITTNVPQDNYSMGGFELIFEDNYGNPAEGGTIKIYGYWNPESNGGFTGFKYTTDNPNLSSGLTIEVGRNSSGKTCFAISGHNQSYAQIIAKNLWLGYSAGSANSTWGDNWSISTTDTTGLTNLDTLTKVPDARWDNIQGKPTIPTDYGDHDGLYLPIGGTATDSELLDGINSTSFLRSDADDSFSGTLSGSAQIMIQPNNYGKGVYGAYSSGRFQHVWGMGSSWHLDPSGANLGNFYGIAYTHTNVGAGSQPGFSHQTLFVENGVPRTWIGQGVRTVGDLISDTSVKAPNFYDLDNTGYYLNPAGISNLNTLSVNGDLTVNGTSTLSTLNVTNTINARTRAVAITGFGSSEFTFHQTSGAFGLFTGWHNYFIGNHGDGSSYYNTTIAMPFWGPPRYSRKEGGTDRGPYEFWTSERTIVSTFDITAPIFRDSDNTTYYLDPAGTSNLGSLTVNGRVGIGTTSPDYKLDISDSSSGNGQIALRNTGSGTAGIWFDASNGDIVGSDYAWIRQNNDLTFEIGVDSLGGDMLFTEGGSERMRISSGNVGIGTTAPTNKLHVDGSIKWEGASTEGILSGSELDVSIAAQGSVPLILSANGNGVLLLDPNDYVYKLGDYEGDNNGSYLEIEDDGQLATFYNLDLDVQGNVYAEGSMRATALYDVNNTSYYVNPNSTSNMVSIQTTSGNSFISKLSGTKSWLKHITTGALVFAPSASNNGSDWSWANEIRLSSNGTITSNGHITRSDERLKTKITDLPCDNIDVAWKSYELKSDEGEKRVGVIAQELEETHPEFVITDSEGFKSVKYIDLLIAKIAELEARLQKLEN